MRPLRPRTLLVRTPRICACFSPAVGPYAARSPGFKARGEVGTSFALSIILTSQDNVWRNWLNGDAMAQSEEHSE